MPQIMRILQGLPGSGKSTYAADIMRCEPGKWARVNYDFTRYGPDGNFPYVFSRQAEKEIKQKAIAFAREQAADGMSLLIDNTNLTFNAVALWTRLADELGMDVQRVEFTLVPIAVCIARDAARTGWRRVGRPVIERMALWNGMLKFPLDKQLVLVDVDGTIADGYHRVYHLSTFCQLCGGTGWSMIGAKCERCDGLGTQKKDWDAYFAQAHADAPILPVIDLIKRIAPFYQVCIVSGRPDDKCGQQTLEWLDKYRVPFEHIFMRQGGDHRPDFLVKREILDRLPRNQIAFVLDDRKQVVDMWRSQGVRVFQVAEGNF